MTALTAVQFFVPSERGLPFPPLQVRYSALIFYEPRSKGERYSGEGHYVVVVGYDDLKNIFHVHDPNGGRKLEVSYDVFKDFHRSHQTHSHYVLCIYPKQK